jgi:ankyrin repeat protein
MIISDAAALERDYVRPIEKADRLEFAVFLASRVRPGDACEELRLHAERALSELNVDPLYGGRVWMRPNKCENLSVGAGGDAQRDIELQADIPTHQIVVGFCDQSIGDDTKRELLLAVNAPVPRPFVLFFVSETPSARTLEATQQSLEVLRFEDELERVHRGFVRRCRFVNADDFRLRLKDELGKYLIRHLRTRGMLPAEEAPARQPWPPQESPYPGLRSMGPGDTRFFGREHEINKFLELVIKHPVLCVRGPSGIGKSSLLMAGLLPRLEEHYPRTVATLVVNLSGGVSNNAIDPFLALARAAASATQRNVPSDLLEDRLAQPESDLLAVLKSTGTVPNSATRLVLCLDQGEYLVTRLPPEPGPRLDDALARVKRFSGALRRSVEAGTLTMLLTMQTHDDRNLSELTELDPLRSLLDGAMVILGPLTREGILHAIRKPAELAGYEVDDALVERLAHDAGESNSLPLLAVALEEIHHRWYARWENATEATRPKREFGSDLYPGFKDIINQLAKEALALASTPQREALARLFWHGVDINLTTKDAHAVRIPYAVVHPDTTLHKLVRLLVDGRIMVDSGDGYEFTHSSVLRHWEDLERWIEDTRTDLEERRYLALRAARWVRNGKRSGDLLSWEDVQTASALVLRLQRHLGQANEELNAIKPLIAESRRIRGLLEGLQKVDFDRLKASLGSTSDLSEEESQARWPFYRALRGTVGTTLLTAEEWTKRVDRGFRPAHFAAFANNAFMLTSAPKTPEVLASPSEGGWTPLHMAAYTGATQAADFLIRAGYPIDEPTADGESPLFVATAFGHREVADLLLRAGAAPDGSPNRKSSPLHTAAADGSVALMEVLLAAGADPSARNPQQRTALHLAAAGNHAAAIAVLLGDDRVDPNAQDEQGFTPLHVAAAATGAVDALNVLIGSSRCDLQARSSADQDEGGFTALHLAASSGSCDACKLLLNEAPSLIRQPSAAESTPLHLAARRNDAEIVRLLLDAGAPIDARDVVGETALHDAARFASKEALAELISRLDGRLLEGAALTGPPQQGKAGAAGRTALDLASFKGRTEVCAYLLDVEPLLVLALDEHEQSALHLAVTEGHLDVARLLVERGATAGRPRGDGVQMLQLAARAGHTAMCEWALTLGLDVNAPGPDSTGPLHWAVLGELDAARQRKTSHATAIAGMLLKAGARADATDARGRNALHYAAAGASVELMRVLVDLGIPINAADNEGRTPLDVAGKLNPYRSAGLVWATRDLPTTRHPVVPWTALSDAARERAASIVGEMTAENAGEARWPGLPVLHAPWEAIAVDSLENALAVLEMQQQHMNISSTLQNHRVLGARQVALPQYPGFSLVELSLAELESRRHKVLSFLWGWRVEHQLSIRPHELLVLDGRSAPMHLLGASLPIALESPEAAAAHLRVFTGYLRADRGAFMLVDSVEGLRLPDDNARVAWRHIIEQVEPLQQVSEDERCFRFRCTLLYGNLPYSATLRVDKWGTVEMEDDSVLDRNPLPVVPDEWQDEYRLL